MKSLRQFILSLLLSQLLITEGAELQLGQEFNFQIGDVITYEFEDKLCGYGYNGFFLQGLPGESQSGIALVYMLDCGWGKYSAGKKGNDVYYGNAAGAGNYDPETVVIRTSGWHTGKLERLTNRLVQASVDGHVIYTTEITSENVEFLSTGKVEIVDYTDTTSNNPNRVGNIRNIRLSNQPVEQWINDGLVAHYPFNGNANDESGNGNDATVENGPAGFGNDGELGFISGNSSYFVVPDNDSIDSLEEGSFSIWLKPNSVSKNAGVFSKTVGSIDGSFMLCVDTDRNNVRPHINHQQGWVYADYGTVFEVDVWYSCLFSYSKLDGLKFYIDGKEVGRSGAQRGAVLNGGGRIDSSDAPLIIGADFRDSNVDGFKGTLKDFRIYNRPLSATEVAQLYEYESQPQPAADPRNATAIAQSVNGFIVGAEVTNGGSGYTSAPEITITGSGTGAVLQGIVSGGKVSSIEVLNPGSGYDSNSRIVIAAPPAQPSLLSISKEGVALKIVVRTQTGRSYQLQRTRGLFEWEDDGDGFTGTGAEVSFFREYFEPYRFWRVKVSGQ